MLKDHENRHPGAVRSMFDGIARRYDLLNHVLSANLDRGWRRSAARELGPGDRMRLLDLCDTFHLPLVYFADEPGFSVGPAQEELGIVRAGARVVTAFSASRTPYICFIVRQLYGVAGGLHSRSDGLFRRYAWPSTHGGSMHIEGGTAIAYKREIENADDPDAKRAEIEARLQAISSPFGVPLLMSPSSSSASKASSRISE